MMTTLVMKYGLLPPTENADVVHKQLFLSHRYKNALIEVDREVRDMIRGEEEPYGLRQLEANAKALAILAKKAKDAERKQEEREARSSLKTLRLKMKVIRSSETLSKRRELIYGKPKDPKLDADGNVVKKTAAERRADKTPNNGIAAKMRHHCRAKSGLFWGTYVVAEKAIEQASGEVYLYDGDEDSNVSFQRWDGQGQLAVQLQGGKSRDSIFDGQCRYVAIGKVDEQVLVYGPRGQRRKAARTTLRMQVGGKYSNQVFAEWPMMYHRPLPKGSVVKWVSVSRRMVGPREQWSCEVTVDVPPVVSVDRVEAVAVSLGWRTIDSGIRVAHWMATDGTTGTLDLLDLNRKALGPDGGRGGVIDGDARHRSLGSIRDKTFREAVATLAGWLESLDSIPAWMLPLITREPTSKAQAIAYLRQWKSQGRLANLIRKWPKEGRCDTYEALEKWRYHDFHLWTWQRSQQVSNRRRRDEIYRVFASRLVSDPRGSSTPYKSREPDKPRSQWIGTVVLDGSNFKGIKDATDDNSAGQLAAVGKLRELLKQAATSRGVGVVKAEAGGTAITCPKCGARDKAHRDKHWFACSECPFQRDVAGVRLLNMLAQNGYEKKVKEIISRGEKVVGALKEKNEQVEV
jgi:predicted RNA-binding Zn-ribbon protein involved in translation (DUF1610 family)